MINITEDIHSLTDFKKNTNQFIHSLKKSGRPTVLTVNGRAEIVVIDAAAFQKIQEQLELEETLLEMTKSFKDFDEGKFASAKEVLSELKKNLSKKSK